MAHELQRLRGVEAAGDAPRAAARQPRGRLARRSRRRSVAPRRPARSPARGRRAGRSLPTACIASAAGARREGEQIERLVRAASPRARGRCRRRGSGSASPSRRRGRSGRAPGRACRRRGSRCGRAESRRQALARELDQRRRDVDRHDIGAARAASTRARRCRSRHRARARRAGRPAARSSSVARIASRPARTVARMPPTGASEVSRFQASTAVRSK
jgi:hypothetical protein